MNNSPHRFNSTIREGILNNELLRYLKRASCAGLMRASCVSRGRIRQTSPH